MHELALLLGHAHPTSYHVYSSQSGVKHVLVALIQELLHTCCTTILADQLNVRKVLKLNQFKVVFMNPACDIILNQAKQKRLQQVSSVVISNQHHVAVDDVDVVTCDFGSSDDDQHQQLVNDVSGPIARMVCFMCWLGIMQVLVLQHQMCQVYQVNQLRQALHHRHLCLG